MTNFDNYSLDDFVRAVGRFCPTGTVDADGYGQLVVYTGLTINPKGRVVEFVDKEDDE